MLPILNQSLWRDEAFTFLMSAKPPFEIIKLTSQDTSPPLHYLILHYWMLIFGNSEASARGLSFIFHLLTVTTVFLISKRLLKNNIVQVFIPFAVLLNPFLLQYAFEARTYSLLAFLGTLAVYLLVSKRNILAGIVLTLAIFTHNFAVFTFIAILTWFIYSNRHTIRTQIGELAKLIILPSVAILAWGNFIYTQWTKVAEGFWIKPATSSIFIHSFEQFARGDLSYPVQSMLYIITLILCFFAFSYWVWKNREETKDTLLLIFFIAVIPLVITYAVSALFVPIYHERYLIAGVPMLIILVGYSLYKLYHANEKIRNFLIGFVAIYLILLVQASEQIISTSTKPPINHAVSQVLSRAEKGDIIIPEDNINFLETKYYVARSGANIPTYAYSPNNDIPFYLGRVLFEPHEIIKSYPEGVRIWQIKTDGGHTIVNN